MDQRRFITFLLVSFLFVVVVDNAFRLIVGQPQPVAPVAEQEDGKAKADAKPQAADAKPQAADAGPPAEDAQAPAEAVEVPQVAAVGELVRFVTIGSLDPTTGYRMMATLTNTGAALRRAEMTSSRYLDQHDWSGYLGELELIDADGGAKVQVVGPGTPAADPAADIKPGDVIVGIKASNETEIKSVEGFRAALAKTQPGQEIGLSIRRGDAAPAWRTVKLVRRPFAVLRPEIDNYRMRGADPPPGFTDIPSFLLTLSQWNGKPLADEEKKRLTDVLEGGNWEVMEQDEKSVAFRRVLPELKLEVAKRYTLEPVPAAEVENTTYPGYNVKLAVEIKNTSDAPQAGLSYRLQGPTGMPLEGWWFAHKIGKAWSAGLRDVVARWDGDSSFQQFAASKILKQSMMKLGEGEQALAFAGVDSIYFAAVMLPLKPLDEAWFNNTEALLVGPKPDERTPTTFTNVTCALTRIPIPLAAGETHTDEYEIFIGPKRPALLAEYKAGGNVNYSLEELVYYGWPIFAVVAKAMLAILHFFYNNVWANYGIAIILLTVVVRGSLFPISYKQTKNMARMQALKPEMDKISAKYKDDMQKRSQAIQELYRKHQINPLGGCLPLFLQLPIFIGLYRALAVDIELRQSPLFSSAIRWCSNLAAPDMLLNWSAVMPDFVTRGDGFLALGPYLNILPLVTVLLFLVTQKMAMPAPTDEQSALQQKMMKYMTVFMGLLFYKVAAGLCLYFIASSLWGIGERKLLPKAKPGEAGSGGSAAGASGKQTDGGPRPGSNGSPKSRRPPKAKRKK